MIERPLVSVIIPSYNVEQYVRDAIESVLCQTYPHVEIVVVDDGSIDGTKHVVGEYVKKGLVQYIYQENRGLSGARNTGIRHAKGKYIALLDADDTYLPERIEKQVNFMEDNTFCDFCYCDTYHFREGAPSQMLKLQYSYYSGKEVLPHLIAGNFIAPSTVMLKKSVFDRFGYFDENIRRSEDIEFWIRIAHGRADIRFLPEILCKLQMRVSGNLQDAKSQPEVKKSIFQILEKLNQKMTSGEQKKYQVVYYQRVAALKTAIAYVINGDAKNSDIYIKKWIQLHPLGLFLVWIPYIFRIMPQSLWLGVSKMYYKIRYAFIFKKPKRL